MLDAKTFKTIITCAKNIDDTMHKIENTFDVNIESGTLLSTFDELLNLLNDTCESIFDGPSAIYAFAFSDKWGKEAREYTIDDTIYVVNDIESLYNYLKIKEAHKSIEEDS